MKNTKISSCEICTVENIYTLNIFIADVRIPNIIRYWLKPIN